MLLAASVLTSPHANTPFPEPDHKDYFLACLVKELRGAKGSSEAALQTALSNFQLLNKRAAEIREIATYDYILTDEDYE